MEQNIETLTMDEIIALAKKAEAYRENINRLTSMTGLKKRARQKGLPLEEYVKVEQKAGRKRVFHYAETLKKN